MTLCHCRSSTHCSQTQGSLSVLKLLPPLPSPLEHRMPCVSAASLSFPVLQALVPLQHPHPLHVTPESLVTVMVGMIIKSFP